MNTISGSVGQYDGVMREWIDDILVINQDNILFRTNQDATKKWYIFSVAPYMSSGAPVSQSFDMDSLIISNVLDEDTPELVQIIDGAGGFVGMGGTQP